MTKHYPHITARIVADSYSTDTQHGESMSRLTTFELTYPRYIHAELMTHRVLSRNAQSSRAIPVKKRLANVTQKTVTPIRWGANQAGMQAKDAEVESPSQCSHLWITAALQASASAELLMEAGLHKQWANRLLEPFDTITVIVTGTEWENMFALRCHPDAQPEFHYLANLMADLYYYHDSSNLEAAKDVITHQLTKINKVELPAEPRLLTNGQWHIPYVTQEEAQLVGEEEAAKLSVARCARVSYLNHDGSTPDRDKDLALHDRLLESGHMSPFEHQAHLPCVEGGLIIGSNFRYPWVQYRKMLGVREVRKFDYHKSLVERGVLPF